MLDQIKMMIFHSNMKIIPKKQLHLATGYTCLNPKCKRQVASIEQLMFCPICEEGALEVIKEKLPF